MRAVLYTLLGWLLLASVAGLGHSFGLTVMLPSTSAVLLVHLAFTRDHAPHTAGPELALPLGLAVAITLGYLEDLHQGTPIGALSLAHGVAYLLAVWAGTRIAVEGAIVRALAAGVVTALVDLLTFAALYWVVGGPAETFRTGWFLESLLTEVAVALVVRTRRRFYQSRPSRQLSPKRLSRQSHRRHLLRQSHPHRPLHRVHPLHRSRQWHQWRRLHQWRRPRPWRLPRRRSTSRRSTPTRW